MSGAHSPQHLPSRTTFRETTPRRRGGLKSARVRRANLLVESLEARLVLSNVFIPSISGSVPTLAATPAPPTLAPAAPTTLSAVAISDTEINLTWQRGDDADQSVTVQRAAGGSTTFATLAILPSHSNVYTDTSCYPGMSYLYRVVASNSLGTSGPSSQQTATTQPSAATLDAPAKLTAIAASPSSVTLSFKDSNPYVSRTDLAIDSTNAQLVSSPSLPFTVSDVGKALTTLRKGWYALRVNSTSSGQIVSDSTTPFTSANVGTVLTIYQGSGWIGGSYTILAVDGSGKATLNAAPTVPTNTVLGFALNGWQNGSYKILSVDAQGRALLAGSPSAAGNTNKTVATMGTPLNQGVYAIERSADGVSYQIVGDMVNATTALTWTDTYLSAGMTYLYRVRLDSYVGGLSDYTAPATVATPKLDAGVPAAPTGLATLNTSATSATSNTLTWADHSGGLASYKIERAPFSWSGTPAWSQVGTAPAGSSSFVDATVSPESFYYYRVRATNADADSAYTTPATARTASPGTGTAKVYSIGPGTAYPSIASLDWTKLGPGDVVEIFPNKDASGNLIPYRENFLISVRGTASNPIRIVGMPDLATGAMPVFNGQGATTAPQFQSHSTQLGGDDILIGTRIHNNQWGWNPGYLQISGLELTGAYRGNTGGLTYTDSQGVVQAYDYGAAGIYLEKADHVTINDCNVHGNGFGIFGAAQDDSRELSDIVIDTDFVHGDGNPGRDREHEIYMEGINITYENSRIGPTRGGGSAIKDRSVGATVINNWIVGGGHLLDLVESQNQQARALTMPAYHDTYVSGNVFYDPTIGGSVSPIHYGGDQGLTAFDRMGVLHFQDNTILTRRDLTVSWRTTLFSTTTPGDTVDARDDVLYTIPDTSGSQPAEQDFLPSDGVGYFSGNWASQGWQVSRAGMPFTGVATGASGTNSTAGNLPAGVDIAALDARIRAGLTGTGLTAVDDFAKTLAGASVSVAVLTNDLDQNGDPLTVASVTQPAHGTATINANAVTYTPKATFGGVDTFSYVVSDGRGGSATAVVTVTVASAATTKWVVNVGDPGYTQFGPYWYTGWGTDAAGHAYRLESTQTGNWTTPYTATWTVAGLGSGSYQVYATWMSNVYDASNSPYTIYDGSKALATTRVDQRSGPSGPTEGGRAWQSLGAYTVSGGTLRVQLTDNANARVCADAILVVPGLPKASPIQAGGSAPGADFTPLSPSSPTVAIAEPARAPAEKVNHRHPRGPHGVAVPHKPHHATTSHRVAQQAALHEKGHREEWHEEFPYATASRALRA